MVRPLRIEYPGAMYHVMSHGNGFQWIYKSEENYYSFIELLQEITVKYNIKIHTFILMLNHYHLLLETPLGNLSKGMLYLNRELARKYNHFSKRKGSVLKSRYKAILIEKEKYYLNVFRYINQNPIRLGISKNVEKYKGGLWYYLNGSNDKISNMIMKIINIDEIKSNIGLKTIGKLINWLNEEEEDISKDNKYKYLQGTKEWIEKIKAKYIDDNKLKLEITERKKYNLRDKNVWKIYKSMQKYKEIKEYKSILVYMLFKYSQLNQAEIADKLNLTNANTVGQRLYYVKKKLKIEGRMRAKINEMEKSEI